jgi:hypothetical protein
MAAISVDEANPASTNDSHAAQALHSDVLNNSFTSLFRRSLKKLSVYLRKNCKYKQFLARLM